MFFALPRFALLEGMVIVIPAEAGIQMPGSVLAAWIPAFAGMTAEGNLSGKRSLRAEPQAAVRALPSAARVSKASKVSAWAPTGSEIAPSAL